MWGRTSSPRAAPGARPAHSGEGALDLYEGRIRVDHFRRGADLYFLTHYHADHMTGLRKGWRRKPIVCTHATAALLRAGKQVDPGCLRPVALDDPFPVHVDGRSMRVTALDANHCPGAAMFLFEDRGERTLVTGDFRLDDRMRAVLPVLRGLDRLLVDATYRESGYAFPPQQKVIDDILAYVDACPKTYVAIETYTIGKNRILRALYEAFGEPFLLEPHRLPLFEALGDGYLATDDPGATRFLAARDRHLDEVLTPLRPGWKKDAVFLAPKGWAARGRFLRGKVGFPYSEHCSWDELCEFVRALAPRRIDVTEGGRVTGETLRFS